MFSWLADIQFVMAHARMSRPIIFTLCSYLVVMLSVLPSIVRLFIARDLILHIRGLSINASEGTIILPNNDYFSLPCSFNHLKQESLDAK